MIFECFIIIVIITCIIIIIYPIQNFKNSKISKCAVNLDDDENIYSQKLLDESYYNSYNETSENKFKKKYNYPIKPLN